MIKFNLACDQSHTFEAWFSTSADYDVQKEQGYVSCPHCGSANVDKALMVPAVSTARSKEKKQQVMAHAAQYAAQAEAMKAMREMVQKVKSTSEDVGEKFPEEARKMHYGEADPRGIYGKASMEEVHELVEEGVDLMPLPDLPDDQN